jgi:hypothetical protein
MSVVEIFQQQSYRGALNSFTRNDRPGLWASWIDASGKRRKRKLEAHTLQQVRTLLSAEKARVEKTVTLGYAPPSVESFGSVAARFLGASEGETNPASLYARGWPPKGASRAILRSKYKAGSDSTG